MSMRHTFGTSVTVWWMPKQGHWRRRAAWVVGALVLLQVLIRVYLYLWPKVTPPAVSFLLDSRVRRRYRDPQRTLAPLQLHDGQVVLEVGGGTGVFTATAARSVAPHGRLISIELQRRMMRQLSRRVRSELSQHLVLLQANALAMPLPAACVDVVYLIAVLPMVSDKHQALREVARVLKPGGLLAVSEELLAPEYVPPAITRRWGKRAGFVVTATVPGVWSYMVLFHKPTTAGAALDTE